ncbi:MAG: Uncharacterised protein [Flavobacteriia bacterium]|nr:MAG: Uncharacterised protein [Flavobacteriia bacterium]
MNRRKETRGSLLFDTTITVMPFFMVKVLALPILIGRSGAGWGRMLRSS